MAIKKLGLVAAMSAGLLLLAGCATSSSVDNGIDQSKVDKAAQALLPAEYLENGIDVASDIPYEPFEFEDENGEIRVLTRAAFPTGLYQTTDTLDPMVVGEGVNLR